MVNPHLLICGVFLLFLLLNVRANDADDNNKNASQNIKDGGGSPTFRGSGRKDKLLVILLDGFRWDYADRHHMRSFARIKDIGVTTEYLKPVFPAMSYPNYYSLVTGLYVENHGMVMNHMYDENRKERFLMVNFGRVPASFWWEEAEPLWVTAMKKGKKSYLYLWPGGEVSIHGVRPTFNEPYKFHSNLETFRQHLDDALQHFKQEEADLIQIYCEYTDYIGHTNGPESPEMAEALKLLDFELETFIDRLNSYQLEKKVNVVIVSDHGMTATDPDSVRRISLDSLIRIDEVELILGQGAIVGVFPKKKGLTEKLYHELMKSKDIHVWRRENLPEEFHMKNNPRTPPIVILAKKGVFITPVRNRAEQIPAVTSPATESYNGFHGYDVEEVEDMRGIFYGFGPGFEEKEKHDGINIVDVYNIMMHLLDLEPLPNNGSWTSVYRMVKSENSASSLWSQGFFTLLASMGGVFMYLTLALFNSLWI